MKTVSPASISDSHPPFQPVNIVHRVIYPLLPPKVHGGTGCCALVYVLSSPEGMRYAVCPCAICNLLGIWLVSQVLMGRR